MGASRADDRVIARGCECIFCGGMAQLECEIALIGLLTNLSLEVDAVVLDVELDAGGAGGHKLAAELIGCVDERHGVSPPGRRERADHARRSGAHHGHTLGSLCGSGAFWHEVLEAAARVHGALRVAALHELVEAALLAAYARADVRDAPGEGLVGPLRVCEQRSAEHDHVAAALAQRALGHVWVAELANGHDGDGKAGVGAHAVCRKALAHGSRHRHEAARRHARGRVWHPPVVITAQVNVEDVHAGRHELLHIGERLLDGAPSSHASEVGGAERLLVVGLLEGKR